MDFPSCARRRLWDMRRRRGCRRPSLHSSSPLPSFSFFVPLSFSRPLRPNEILTVLFLQTDPPARAAASCTYGATCAGTARTLFGAGVAGRVGLRAGVLVVSGFYIIFVFGIRLVLHSFPFRPTVCFFVLLYTQLQSRHYSNIWFVLPFYMLRLWHLFHTYLVFALSLVLLVPYTSRFSSIPVVDTSFLSSSLTLTRRQVRSTTRLPPKLEQSSQAASAPRAPPNLAHTHTHGSRCPPLGILPRLLQRILRHHPLVIRLVAIRIQPFRTLDDESEQRGRRGPFAHGSQAARVREFRIRVERGDAGLVARKRVGSTPSWKST
ncbi:hypothetical protein B0H16DRAFT_837743 [Mycena metata]|uniref:Uncharacterized protein n=1 Tax=Mycena metata TaxID=1033252 RepID=A0AAD7N957_9AGAR|nr:hypothetical protein B0H16DRAFT_837743 [Mycena metata]